MSSCTCTACSAIFPIAYGQIFKQEWDNVKHNLTVKGYTVPIDPEEAHYKNVFTLLMFERLKMLDDCVLYESEEEDEYLPTDSEESSDELIPDSDDEEDLNL